MRFSAHLKAARHGSPDARNWVEDKVDDAEDWTVHTVENAEEAVKGTVDQVVDTARQISDDVADAVDAAVKAAEEAGEVITHKIRDIVDEAIKKAEELVETIADAVKEAVKSAVKKVAKRPYKRLSQLAVKSVISLSLRHQKSPADVVAIITSGLDYADKKIEDAEELTNSFFETAKDKLKSSIGDLTSNETVSIAGSEPTTQGGSSASNTSVAFNWVGYQLEHNECFANATMATPPDKLKSTTVSVYISFRSLDVDAIKYL
ncbi:hypothetical protein AOL_s00006g588 [Orbilia oligospora ATCC 24927]|uniref:Uncharacterized protein n=1 Tax=Arthrobotrys oligospora (strain ATCC 24927 / CBS 115.81 / DSM 1491) TaxID=756982 RepID=G1X137_ARTOA|nr:hypothetical protein AOL_s00006g588 [Orbilia oligospora ATCC 24927]EGX53210.1 hypothetical protein AOL_s00006g588 [Orbilia oligospora ATCC 24927]